MKLINSSTIFRKLNRAERSQQDYPAQLSTIYLNSLRLHSYLNILKAVSKLNLFNSLSTSLTIDFFHKKIDNTKNSFFS